MNQFTIRDIENLCGIRAHTLRSWEQRCKLFVAKRKQSRHRVYDNEDLKELLRISYLYHRGFKVSQLANLNATEILEQIRRQTGRGDEQEWFILQLTEAAIGLDRDCFDKLINTLVIRMGLEKAMLTVIYPFLRKLGLLWMTDHLIPAQEHLCSHIIRKKIICSIDGLDRPTGTGPLVLIFAPGGEQHEIPLLFAHYLLKKSGIRTVYFGTGVPLDALSTYLGQFPADYIFTHVITRLAETGLQDYLPALHRATPKLKIAVAGGCCGKDYPYVTKLKEPGELTGFIHRSAAGN